MSTYASRVLSSVVAYCLAAVKVCCPSYRGPMVVGYVPLGTSFLEPPSSILGKRSYVLSLGPLTRVINHHVPLPTAEECILLTWWLRVSGLAGNKGRRFFRESN